MKNIVDYAKSRYTTKHYDKAKKLTAEQMAEIKELLRLAASSVNSQPWHFIIVSSDEAKDKLAKSTQGLFDFNEGKVRDAAATVIFCARTSLDDEYLQHITDKEREDGRFSGDKEIEKSMHDGRSYFVNLNRDHGFLAEWAARQTYLNIGSFLLGVAAMGLDATPIEGFHKDIVSQEFNLADKNLDPVCLVSVGHRTADDGNAHRPKSRLAVEEVTTEV